MSVWKNFGLVALAGLMLAACDQREERLDRAGRVVDGVREQIAEEALGQDIDRPMLQRVKPAARALQGKILSETELSPRVAPQTSRFAVGSIIAKPAAMEMAMAPIMAEAPAPIDEEDNLPVLALPDEVTAEIGQEISSKPQVAKRIQKIELPTARELPPLEAPKERLKDLTDEKVVRAAPRVALPPPPDGAVPKAQRRLAMSAPQLEVQDVARSRMLDAMDKYGLEGRVDLDRGGQMVIQIGSDGADPTQFAPEAGPEKRAMPRFAMDMPADECPDNVAPAAVRDNPVLATACVIKELRQTGEFEYVEKDYILEHQFARKPKKGTVGVASIGPNDPLFDLQWHYKSNGTGEGQSPGGAGFIDFWTTTSVQGSPEVVVAVVDTGLQLAHPDIARSTNVKPGWDFVSDPRMGNDGDGRDSDPNDPGDMCDPTDPFDEDTFHGTHVAGVIGAASTNNAEGIAGGAWSVSIVPVRAMGRCGGRLSDINEAIRWAAGLVPAFDEEGNEVWNEYPADVINLSLGLFERCPASLQDAIDSVVERGVIVVAAAGNAKISTEFYAPGGCMNVVSVAAGDARGQIAPYSNFGAEVDIMAPGGDLTRDDNGDGLPDGVLSTKLARDCQDPVTKQPMAECNYAYEQGTSMAAPHVSAALALLKARYPDYTPSELIDLLLSATITREPGQCAGSCTSYPGADPLPGQSGMCSRPCGVGLLDLAQLPK